MIRLLVLSLVAILGLVSTSARAQTSTTGWIKVATLTLDPRSSGTRTIDLPDLAFRELRFTADKPVTISAVKTSSGGAFRASGGGYVARPGTPSASFHVTKDPAGLKQVEITWNADTSATGTVKLEVWALTGQAINQSHAEKEAKEAAAAQASAAEARRAAAEGGQRNKSATSGSAIGSSRDGTSSAPFPSPPSPPMPATRAAPSSRGGGSGPPSPTIGAPPPPPPPSPTTEQPPRPKTRAIIVEKPSPPPPPPVAPSPSEPSSSAGKPADKTALPPVVNSADAKPNVCVDANICTIVDVFFGTDRKQAESPARISFGGERSGKLQLGHAFVTVPKAQRAKGAIPLPSLWDKWVRGVPPEGDPARHFTIPKDGVTVYSTEAEFLGAAKKHIANAGDFKDHAFIFVHGFYVTFDNALYRTAQISYDLSPDGKPFGTAFMYSWPSAGDATSYLYDQDSANFASLHLQSFIKTVVDKTGVKNVHIIAHSMGNVALIGALQELARTESKTKINQIILAAPDVDKQQFETIIQSVEKVAKGITLYASQGDNALALARKARRGLPRAGETRLPPGPAVVTGIDTIDVSAINTDVWSWGHDTYADSKELLADIGTIFTKGDPPAKRSPKLRFGDLKYWIYGK